jgi:hypothetical protein
MAQRQNIAGALDGPFISFVSDSDNDDDYNDEYYDYDDGHM